MRITIESREDFNRAKSKIRDYFRNRSEYAEQYSNLTIEFTYNQKAASIAKTDSHIEKGFGFVVAMTGTYAAVGIPVVGIPMFLFGNTLMNEGDKSHCDYKNYEHVKTRAQEIVDLVYENIRKLPDNHPMNSITISAAGCIEIDLDIYNKMRQIVDERNQVQVKNNETCKTNENVSEEHDLYRSSEDTFFQYCEKQEDQFEKLKRKK